MRTHCHFEPIRQAQGRLSREIYLGLCLFKPSNFKTFKLYYL